MLHTFSSIAFFATCLAVLSFGAGADVPFPTIPSGEGEKCVEPTEEMRVNHMDYILHQRDLTVHEGVRTKKHSLSECINCHVQPDKNGNIARIDTDEHFCNACHSYAAVKIDCFECHADRPQKYIQTSSMGIHKQLSQLLSSKEEVQ